MLRLQTVVQSTLFPKKKSPRLEKLSKPTQGASKLASSDTVLAVRTPAVTFFFLRRTCSCRLSASLPSHLAPDQLVLSNTDLQTNKKAFRQPSRWRGSTACRAGSIQCQTTACAAGPRLLCTGPMRKSIKMAAREEMWTRNNGWVRGCYEQHLCELISLFNKRFTQDEWLLEVLWASLFWTIPRCPMSEQECRIDHFRVTLVAKAFCPYASFLKFCQTSGKFSHVDEVPSVLSMYVAAPRVLWLLRALQDCCSSSRLAIDGMLCGRLQALFPLQRYALPGKRL